MTEDQPQETVSPEMLRAGLIAGAQGFDRLRAEQRDSGRRVVPGDRDRIVGQRCDGSDWGSGT